MSFKEGRSIKSRDILLFALCVPFGFALQQQSKDHTASIQYGQGAQSTHRSPVESSVPAPSLPKPDADSEHNRIHEQSSFHHDERALATLSPIDAPSVGKNNLLTSPSTKNGLSSRHTARSLQDWRVEEIVLLATVDGKIYARDRITGAHRWLLEVDRPMVETIYHRHNKSVGQDGMVHEDPLWIVEPSQDGSIYVYASGSGLGLQRLGYTVKQLAELSPYASDGTPAVAYTAEKKTTLYTIDAASGHILKKFSSAGSISNQMQDRCRRVSPLDSLDDDECEAIGVLTLGHTEYTIGIQDRLTGEQISTIRYFEWGPNNRDDDLRNRYTQSMDGKYISTKHDGYIYGLDLGQGSRHSLDHGHKPSYLVKLSAPVARVYDVVRPAQENARDTSLVVLPQPLVPAYKGGFGFDQLDIENIFVNCTESGSWYALSEKLYPTVTEGAKLAKCYGDGFFSLGALPLPKNQRDKFTGIHWLASPTSHPRIPQIDPPASPGQSVVSNLDSVTARPTDAATAAWRTKAFYMLLLPVFLLAGAVRLWQRDGIAPARTSFFNIRELLPPNAPHTKNEGIDGAKPIRLREDEPAEETIFPPTHTTGQIASATPTNPHDRVNLTSALTFDVADEDNTNKDNKKTKLHKRGKRGGRKVRERENEIAEKAQILRANDKPELMEVISVAASESPQISGPLQINSLIINTDRVIGQGSCGTSVFEGSFEGRSVAVKRMLSQYYELASQEVSFLQQSDDHPNVVRYFCQQRDDHFLYIAVELCQASLFEVWDSEKSRSEERQRQLQTLKLAIQQDVPQALQQLAAGLHHLHNLRIIHRDIKPQNILVAYPKRGQSVGTRLVISDFGLGKNLPENVSTLIDPTNNAGTSGWKAPELITQPREGDGRSSHGASIQGGSEVANGTTSGIKRAADIFSLGCLFFWVMTDGCHPYEDANGWHQLRELNIKRDHKNMEILARWSEAYEPMQLITSMLAHEPGNRPTASEVVNHPFFWSAEKRLGFLCDVSDHFEREPRGSVEDGYLGDSDQLQCLEIHARIVIDEASKAPDFLSKLDRSFVDTLGKQRKYNGGRLLDLLRALRNKKNHYEDMSEDVKRRVGPLSAGYLRYWCIRFPKLLMVCYQVIHDVKAQDSDRFRSYFTA